LRAPPARQVRRPRAPTEEENAPITLDKAQRINREITAPEVRLVADDGEQLGIVPVAEALRQAEERDVDLVEIAPLANLPVIRDLVTDMREFFDKWARAKGSFVPTATRHDDFAVVRSDKPERRAADAAIECIGCAVCYASCDVVRWSPAYLGPAALNRVWTLVNDERDGDRRTRLAAVAGDAGCHACHTQMGCTERCPKEIAPTASIAGLKRLTARAALKGEL